MGEEERPKNKEPKEKKEQIGLGKGLIIGIGGIVVAFLGAVILPMYLFFMPMKADIGFIKANINSTNEKIDTLCTKEGLDNKILKLNQDLTAKITEKTEAIDERIDTLNTNIKIIETVIKSKKDSPDFDLESINARLDENNESLENIDTRVASIQGTIYDTFSTIAEVFSEGVQTIEGEYWGMNTMEHTIQVRAMSPVVDTKPRTLAWSSDTRFFLAGKELAMADFGKIKPGENIRIKFYKLGQKLFLKSIEILKEPIKKDKD